MNPTPEVAATDALDSLAGLMECIGRICEGAWKFIRLRDSIPLGQMIDKDDVDLLGTRESSFKLLSAVFSWVKAGDCHARIRSGSAKKISLSLLSTDCRHRIDLDLWIELWQIDGRRRCLRFEDCAAIALNPDSAIQELPIQIEGSIFIQHLVCKGKKVSAPKQISRLEKYASGCRDAGHAEIAQALEESASQKRISQHASSLALTVLSEAMNLRPGNALERWKSRLVTAVSRLSFMPPGRLRMLGIMGCDGSGKTSLSKSLLNRPETVAGFFVGKHLYRKSMFYKVLVTILRPLTRKKNRETIDDRLAPLLYILASIRLHVKLMLYGEKGPLLVDRSIVDFLMVYRKTDRPRFSRFLFLTTVLGKRITHIHVLVPYDQLVLRKAEMTERGHESYDQMMFDHFSKRSPTDHILFNNSGQLDESTERLQRIITLIAGT